MKKIDLYEIAIKVAGLYLVIMILDQLRSFLAFIPISLQQDQNTSGANQTPVFLVMGFGLVLLLIFAWLLLFRTKKIAKFITQPSDAEEEVKLFAEKKTIFEICLVLLGLLVIVWTLPDFIIQLKNYISFTQREMPIGPSSKTFLITSGIKVIVGLLAIVYATPLSGALAPKTKTAKIDGEE